METKPVILEASFGERVDKNFLHIIIRCRTRETRKNSLEQHHHKKETERTKTIFGNFFIGISYDSLPVETQLFSEKRIMPSCRHLQRMTL